MALSAKQKFEAWYGTGKLSEDEWEKVKWLCGLYAEARRRPLPKPSLSERLSYWFTGIVVAVSMLWPLFFIIFGTD